MIWGRPPSQTSPGRLFCVGVYMCRCVHVGAHVYRYMRAGLCKISSMQLCAHVYTGACRYVRASAFPTVVVSSAKGGAEPEIHSLATPLVSATWLGWHVCATLHTLVGL